MHVFDFEIRNLFLSLHFFIWGFFKEIQLLFKFLINSAYLRKTFIKKYWWAWEDSNFRPLDYQSNALTKTELQALITNEHSTFELVIRQLL